METLANQTSSLVICLFGKLTVEYHGVAVSGLQQREGYRLLAYLVLNHGRNITYRSLAERFWPSEARSASDSNGEFPSTRQAIRALRVALGPDAERLQSVSKGIIRLDLTGVSVDWIVFQQKTISLSPDDWQQALVLCARSLLDGWTDPWAEEERRRCEQKAEMVRRKLSALPIQESPVSPPTEVVDALRLEETDGAVPLNSPFYIVRDTDARFIEALRQQDSIVLVKGARQMGKTSLLARGLQEARRSDVQVVLTDLQSIPSRRMDSADTLYYSFATGIALQLETEGPRHDWDDDFDASLNLERFLRRILQKTPLVWGLDEVDRLFTCPFGSEVFGLFRSWHNRRALEPTGPWSRLTLAISYATEAHLFIADSNQSPFNVGTRLSLSDFSEEETAQLNERYGSPLPSPEALRRFYNVFGGHPYLSRLALNLMVGHGYRLEEVIHAGEEDDTPFDPHLRHLLNGIVSEPQLLQGLRTVLQGKPCPDLTTYYRLRSAGLILGNSQSPEMRCPVYTAFFSRHLP